MPPTKFIRIALVSAGAGAALAVAAGALPAFGAEDDGWQSAGKGKTSGISGIAPVSAGTAAGSGSAADGVEAIVVRDNKDAGENRIASVTYREGKEPKVEPLDWKGGALPTDLEALTDVPGEKDGYLAAESSGNAYHLTVKDGAATVVDAFKLPGVESGAEIENLTLGTPPSSSAASAPEGKLIAVWGDRGEDDRPGTLNAAPVTFDSAGKSHFGDVESGEVQAPYPSKDVRHASDTRLTEKGALLVSSASDPGDDGPFDSAVYAAGKVGMDGSGAVSLSLEKDPEALKKFEKHKIEALACLPGSDKAVLGTDDENDGGSLTTSGGICEG